MIDYLIGSISELNKHYIVLEVKGFGIGYKIYHSNPFYYELHNEYKILIYLQIKEDEWILYGFENNLQRDLFLKLIEVNGVGPKTAMNIISCADYETIISSINNEDYDYLRKISGIGSKLSQQIILDLKGCFDNCLDTNLSNPIIEAKEVLRNLNFKQAEIDSIFKQINTKCSTTQEYVKCALSLLRR